MEPLLLRAAVKRGFLLVAANWPIAVIDFTVEAVARLALIVPIVGGALMVTVVAGIDVRTLLSGGLWHTADVVVGSLASAPAALATFLGAVAIVAVGGEALKFVVKAGTLSVIVRADASVGEIQRRPIGTDTLRQARSFGLGILVDAGRRFARRGVVLSLWLGLAYGVVAIVYVALVTRGLPGDGASWVPAWSALVLGATSAAVVVIGVANLAYTLLRVVIVTDDCPIAVAVGRLAQFAIEDARQVIGVFAAVGGIELVAAALAVLVAGALAPIAYLPAIGLLVVPLQAAIWLLRALLFEFLSLTAVAAYQTQYRRFAQVRREAVNGTGGTDVETARGEPDRPPDPAQGLE